MITEEQAAIAQILIWLFLIAAAVVYFVFMIRFYCARGDLAAEYEHVVDEHESIESYVADWFPEVHR